ncbi:hypothetical protein NKR19_g5995 [Coniochaeta hoffmannii]|uniref:Uncharacterized protein n=1 Tax=Coniochaeta hoffmannii TaxID=91930 RepID=A0AA38VUA9_9PEZI|nr:hypothetical protein NKR19_g5995 [Coniochaeta hoffmannii]
MASPPLSPPPLITHPADEERPDSRNSSINFSYPSRVRVGSPAPSPTTARGFESPQPLRAQDQAAQRASSGSSSTRTRPASVGAVQSLVYDPNSRRMVPREAPAYDDYQGPAGRSLSVRKKKKQPAKTGTHLAQATMGRTKVGPGAAAYENVQQPQAVPSTSRSLPHDQPQQVLTTSYHVVDDEVKETADNEPAVSTAPAKSAQPTETSRVPFATHAAQNLVDPEAQKPAQPSRQVTDEEPAVKSLISAPRSDVIKNEQQRPQEPLPPTGQLQNENAGPEEFTWVGQGVRRQPSTVKEEPEPEDEGPHSPGGHTVANALDAVPTRQKPDSTICTNISGIRTKTIYNANAQGERYPTLTVKHCPPPRSVSPRKSALKNSTSPDRRASLDDNVSEASTSFSQRDDTTMARKKSVRVSFDDSNTVVVGESPGPDMGDSPIIASPQNTRRPWYSNIARGKKPEMATLDDDEIMKPRPVLPSFGSVRDKKPRDSTTGSEERPLVRPVIEPSTSPSMSASPSSLPAIPHVSDELRTDSSLNAMTTGSDSIGSNQAESDQRARIAANTSKLREPLPPVVTSIEGSGYVSDTSSSDEEQIEGPGAEEAGEHHNAPPVHLPQPIAQQRDDTTDSSMLPSPDRHSQVSAAFSEADFQDTAPSASEEARKDVEHNIPTIAISSPTPPPPKVQSNMYFDVPGGFPEDDSDLSTPDADPYSGLRLTSMSEIKSPATPVRQVTFEPVTQPKDATQAPHTPATVTATLAPILDEDDDESSIYSDAPDHFTDTENEGFMSLDAVVGRSLPSKAKETETAPQPVEATPPPLGTELSTATTAVDTTQSGEPPALDWDKAKSYWRSLTADKRAQLEKEALSDAGVDADGEDDAAVSHKPKKKKSIERRNSERKALAVRMAQQTIAAQQKQNADDERLRAAERTYMIKPGTKLRASMRTNGATSKPSQQEQPRPHALGGKTLRPASVGSAPAATKTMRSPQRVSSPPVAVATARNSFNPPPPIRRRGSDSSESSFRRTSRPESGQGFGFRRTLRQQSPAQSERAGRPSGRFSLRSMSPPSPTSRVPSGGMGMGMRTSLRSPKETKPSSGGLHFGHFGKKSSKSAPKSTAGSSRFSDSSDDDDGRRTFRSRFDESSDEDDIRAPAPLSLPKTMRGSRQDTDTRPNRRYQAPELSPPLPEEQEETDLEDNLRHNEEKEPISPLPQQGKNARSGRGGLVASPPATPLEAPKTSRRGSFMSVLRRRRDKNKTGGIARPEVMDSAARRDTKLERSPDELKEIRRSGDLDREGGEEDVGGSSSPARPRSPRLQKRTNSMPLDAVVSGGWPLGSPGSERPPSPANGVGKVQRPATSGNLGTRTMSSSSARPVFGQRRTASSHLLARVHEEGSVAGGERKKKKFGALRKMFGLDD